MSRRITFEEMKQTIKECGIKPGFTKKWYEENYKNFNSRLPLICGCGNPFEITVQTIKNKTKKECIDCQLKTKSKSYQIHYEELIKGIKELRCKPDFAKRWYNANYKGQDTELPLICSCKKSFTRSYREFRRKPLCDTCKIENKGSKRLSYEEVVKNILKRAVVADFTEEWFNENYTGNECLLPLVCRCKKSFELSYKNLYKRKDIKCGECRTSGESSPSYKKFIRLESIAKKNHATLSITPEWLETNEIKQDTLIPFSCKCGNEDTLIYKKVAQNNLICGDCRKKANKQERQLRAMKRKEEYLLGDLNFNERDLY